MGLFLWIVGGFVAWTVMGFMAALVLGPILGMNRDTE